jgi:hypothetical protein
MGRPRVTDEQTGAGQREGERLQRVARTGEPDQQVTDEGGGETDAQERDGEIGHVALEL